VNGFESVEAVILLEKEGGLRIENDHLGQGSDSFVVGKVEVEVVEEGVILMEN
jgi:hypothetical protein